MAAIKSKGGKVSGLWVTLENGAQATESRKLIRMALDRLRGKRELVTLAHKGYQSPRTVIIGYDEEEMEIDRPLDWPGSHPVIHLLFKDESQVWNQIRVRVLRAEGNSIFTEFPSRLIRLQRRSNYRVGVPNGSTATFMYNNERFQGFQVVDISANGVLVCVDGDQPLEIGGKVFDLALFFPGAGTGLTAGTYINIRKAKVMRTARDDNKKYCYGIFFELSQNEEELLLQYVRQRERELLRKGLSD
ncbi:flagellar brake protein [Thiovibrio sp. JS02]